MSGEDPQEGQDPSAPTRTSALAPLRLVVEGEARRLLSEAQIAADPERLAQGWERRFMADASRVAEVVQLYHELGYQTAVDPIRPADVGDDCGDCQLLALHRLKMIYVRRPGAASGGEAREEGA